MFEIRYYISVILRYCVLINTFFIILTQDSFTLTLEWWIVETSQLNKQERGGAVETLMPWMNESWVSSLSQNNTNICIQLRQKLKRYISNLAPIVCAFNPRHNLHWQYFVFGLIALFWTKLYHGLDDDETDFSFLFQATIKMRLTSYFCRGISILSRYCRDLNSDRWIQSPEC